MSTMGRNAPCPCGSGKKYKKCCLNKVEPLTTEPVTRPAESTDSPPSDSSVKAAISMVESIVDSNAEHAAKAEARLRRNLEEEQADDKFDGAFPGEDDAADDWVEAEDDDFEDEDDLDFGDKLGDADKQWLDDWRDEFSTNVEKGDNEKAIASIHWFIDQKPDIFDLYPVSYLLLPEMRIDLLKVGKLPLIDDLLLRIYCERPLGRRKNAGLMAVHLVVDSLATGRGELVPKLLAVFSQHLDEEAFYFEEIVTILLTANREDGVLSLATVSAWEVMAGADWLIGQACRCASRWLETGRFIPYLEKGECSEEAIDRLCGELEPLRAMGGGVLDRDVIALMLRGGCGQNALDGMLKQIERDPRNKKLPRRLYEIVYHDFARFLRLRNGMGWLSAFFHAGLVFDYYLYAMEHGKRPGGSPFGFNLPHMEEYIREMFVGPFLTRSVPALATLAAFGFFADYLEAQALAPANVTAMMRTGCRSLYQDIRKLLNCDEPGSILYPESFPEWKVYEPSRCGRSSCS